MKTINLIKAFITSSLLIILVVFSAAANAATLDISGNASNSNNSIQFNQNNPTNVNQSNSANVNNNVNVNSNTGGNSISGGVGDGSIKTGDATTKVNINNQFNTNIADVDCCPKDGKQPTPTLKPGAPTPTGKQPVPTTVPGGNGQPGNGAAGNGGVGGPGADPAVLGLPVTSGENSLIDLLKLLPAFGSLTLGYSLLRKNA